MKRVQILAVVLGLVSVGGIALAHTQSPPMVVWSNNQTLTYSDLNNALAHIHNTFSGGITDTMVSTSAAIQHTKLAVPALVPKAWATIQSSCSGAAGTSCTIAEGSRVTSVKTTATTGAYNITFTYTTVDANFLVKVQPYDAALICYPSGWLASATNQVLISCVTAAAGTPTAVTNGFGFEVLDAE